MVKKNPNLNQNIIAYQDHTLEGAKKYEKGRFDKGKMLKYHHMEMKFARHAYELVGSESHIIDIPCGSGRFFDVFSKAKSLVMADYSMNMLTECENKFGNPAHCRFIHASIFSIPLADGECDLCFCMRLFHHVENDQKRLEALKELSRVSKKYVALSFYNHNLRFFKKKLLGKKIKGNFTSYGHFMALAKEAGLEPVSRFPKINIFTEQCLVVFKKGPAS